MDGGGNKTVKVRQLVLDSFSGSIILVEGFARDLTFNLRLVFFDRFLLF